MRMGNAVRDTAGQKQHANANSQQRGGYSVLCIQREEGRPHGRRQTQAATDRRGVVPASPSAKPGPRPGPWREGEDLDRDQGGQGAVEAAGPEAAGAAGSARERDSGRGTRRPPARQHGYRPTTGRTF